MCKGQNRPSKVTETDSAQPAQVPATGTSTTTTTEAMPTKTSWRPLLSRFWTFPFPLWTVVFVYIFVLPSSCFLNRGYTQWFHWTWLAFLLSRSEFLARCLALQGTSVTLGWYAALHNDYRLHGRFAHILLWNMPTIMKLHMLEAPIETGIPKTTALAILLRIGAHTLDTLGHPILALYFWRREWKRLALKQADGINKVNGESGIGYKPNARTTPASVTWADVCSSILTWDVIFATYLLSRWWSILHVYINHQRQFGLFYFGYDVYTISDLDSWSSAYIAEGILYGIIVLWKLCFQRRIQTPNRSYDQDTVPVKEE